MDLHTLNIVIFFVSLVMAGAMFALHRAIPREPCLRDWASVGVLHMAVPFVSSAVISGQQLPWWLIALSNTAYAGGNAMLLVGVRRYLGLRVRLDAMLACVLAFYALNWLPAVRGSYSARLAVNYVVLIGLSGWIVQMLLRHSIRGMRAAFNVVVCIQVAYMLQSAVRIPLYLFAHDQSLVHIDSRYLYSSASLATILFLLLNTMGCSLLVARRQEVGLQESALRDPLTGWHNRRSLAQHAERRFASARPGVSAFGLVLIDIDHFKRINDGFGHPVGDAAIRHVTAIGERVFRVHDVLARLGGEEFCAMVDCADEDDLFQMSERWRAAIEAEPMPLGEQSLPFTVSVGYSLRTQADDGLESVLKRADFALYAAKSGGRNRVGRPVY